MSTCERTTSGEMSVVWSKHAVERVLERFSNIPDTQIPNRTIQKIGRLVEVGEEYHIKRFIVDFVCKRVEEDVALVVTVLYS